MKSWVLLTVTLATLTLSVQGQQLPFKHIVVVIQENRTPDNLFSDCNITGADLIRNGDGLPLDATGLGLPHGHQAFVENQDGQWSGGAKTYVAAQYITPYCALANQYAFANRMFQTNQGPSFPAHQFLFGGTSAPTANSPLFAAENPSGHMGCVNPGFVNMIDPSGRENQQARTCFEREVLTDKLDAAALTWRYYAANALWATPITISHICQPQEGMCSGDDWKNMITDPTQVLTDIANCNLPNVAWVTPAGAYSDHPGVNKGKGPAWVASIVNAVGKNPRCRNGETYWSDTALILTWDDWGGFYDHVAPLRNNTGWGQSYVYGFRVPLVVISAYTPKMVDNQPHDFGSILRLIEDNWGLGTLHYADLYADNMFSFFSKMEAQPFVTVEAPVDDFSDRSDPDDD